MYIFGEIYFSAVDEYGRQVKRSKHEWPYSYDGFVTYRNGENSEVKNTVYSDRLVQWEPKKSRELMQKHFGETGDYWNGRSPKKIEEFLREYYDNKKISIVLIMEYCNASTGYPVWRFDYK